MIKSRMLKDKKEIFLSLSRQAGVNELYEIRG